MSTFLNENPTFFQVLDWVMRDVDHVTVMLSLERPWVRETYFKKFNFIEPARIKEAIYRLQSAGCVKQNSQKLELTPLGKCVLVEIILFRQSEEAKLKAKPKKNWFKRLLSRGGKDNETTAPAR